MLLLNQARSESCMWVFAFFLAVVVALILAMACSGTRHKTSGFTFCNDSLLNYARLNFDTKRRHSGKEMVA